MIKFLAVKNKVLEKGIHYITSDYKTRNTNRGTHNGIDLIGKFYSMDNVVSIERGRVSGAGYNASMGYYININHGPITSTYYHLKKGSLQVKLNDYVSKNRIIGYMGSTGNSTGNHLHFGIKTNVFVDPKSALVDNNYFYKERVKILQSTLNKTYKSNLVVDGILGIKTESVVKKHLIKVGNKNNYVKFIQSELYLNGYNLLKDGIFGKETDRCIRDYQMKNNLTVDGIVGINTIKMVLH